MTPHKSEAELSFDAETYYGETRPNAGLLFQERVSTYTKKQASQIFQRLYRALRHAEKAHDQHAVAWANLHIAMMLRGQRQHTDAIHVLVRVLSIFESIGDELGLGITNDELSCVNRELSRNALSLQYSDRAVKIFQSLSKSMELGWAYDNMSITYFNMSRQKESLIYAKKARAIFEQYDMKNALAWNACNLGNLYFEMGSYTPAENYYSQALEMFKTLHIQQGQAWSLLWLGMLNRARSAFDKAIPYLEQAQREFTALRIDDRAGWCLLNIAAIKWVQGKSDEALELNNKAMRLFRPLHNYDGIGWATFQIAQVLRDRGQLMKAWETIRRAIELFDHIASQKGLGWSQNEMGRIYDAMKDADHARECFIKADAIASQLEALPLKAEANKNLAHHFMDQASFNQALGYLSKAQSISEKLKASELEAAVLIAATRYALIVNDKIEARSKLQQVDLLVKRSGLSQLAPVVALFQAELLISESKYDAALNVLVEINATCQSLKMKTVGSYIAFGLLQLQYRGKWAAAAKSLKTLQTDVRAMGIRKMRSKILALQALIACETNGKLDLDLCQQSLDPLGKSDLALQQWQLSELFAYICRREGNEAQAAQFDRMRTSLELLPGRDEALFHSRHAHFDSFPISIIS